MCNILARVQNRHAPPLREATIDHLDPEYEVDPMAATARPRHCKLDTTLLSEHFGINLTHVAFEDWWSEEMQRKAAAEEERLRRQAEAEEEQRRNAEKARASAAVAKAAEAVRSAEEERRRRMEEEATSESHEEQGEGSPGPRMDEGPSHLETSATDNSTQGATSSAQKPLQDSGHSETTIGDNTPAASVRENDLDACKAASTAAPPALEQTPQTAAATPSSPNPSFSSLRARPTPPGTSGVRSPSSSQPASLRNVEGVPASAAPDGVGDASRDSPIPGADDASKTAAAAGPSTPPSTARPNPFRQPKDTEAVLSPGGDVPADPAARGKAGASDEDEDIYGRASPRKSAPLVQKAAVEAQGKGVEAHSEPDRSATLRRPDTISAAQTTDASKQSAKSATKQPLFTIKVGDPHKVGDGMTGHIVYTVRTVTDAANFKAAQFSSLRRYSDFRWLHAALVHSNPGVIIPPVPEKVRGLISRFSPDLVEARRHGLEVCVNKISNHPLLSKDEDLQLFLESEDFARDVKLREARKGPVPTPEQKTWMGWSGTVGVNSGQKFHEFDEWFDNQRGYLDSLEAQLKQMVRGINSLAQSRKEVADTISASSHALMLLSASSLSRSLSSTFAGLADIQRHAQDLEELQSDRDIRHFGAVLYEYERSVGSVRKAFSTRVDCWHSMTKADEEFRKARAKHDKLKRDSSGGASGGVHPGVSSFYYEESLKELGETESRSLERRSIFDQVSKRCKDEMTRFDVQRVEDMKAAMEAWLEGMIQRKEDLLEEWCGFAERCLGLELWSEDDLEKRRQKQMADEADKGANSGQKDLPSPPPQDPPLAKTDTGPQESRPVADQPSQEPSDQEEHRTAEVAKNSSLADESNSEAGRTKVTDARPSDADAQVDEGSKTPDEGVPSISANQAAAPDSSSPNQILAQESASNDPTEDSGREAAPMETAETASSRREQNAEQGGGHQQGQEQMQASVATSVADES